MTNNAVETRPSLSDKMRQSCDRDLCKLADEFDAATTALYATPSGSEHDEIRKSLSKKMLGAWARARMAWCKHTGETLI